MKRSPSVLCLLLTALILSACAGLGPKPVPVPNAGIVPAPAKCEMGRGSFVVRPRTQIVVLYATGAEMNPDLNTAELLRDGIAERAGLELRVATRPREYASESPRRGTIWLAISPVSNHPEGYALTVSPKGVVIKAPTQAGLIYGAQSLLQMIGAQTQAKGGPVAIPAVNIQDQPRYGYRGFMLDEAGHCLGVKNLERTLDIMASLKLNRLHWHITDTRGWCIEIKKYPRLTQVSPARPIQPDGQPFYTQDDVRELVAYARARNIMIIPEIDMPGHAIAATRAYPELSGGGEKSMPNWTFDPAKPETYKFLEDVLTEVATLFPDTPYIHIGGDEVYFGYKAWMANPRIARFGREHGANSAIELEHYFDRRMADYIRGLGKKTMGWDEMTTAGVPRESLTLFWWHNERTKLLTDSLAAGYDWVLCPRDPCYFDFIQYPTQKYGRKIFGNTKLMNDLARVYDNFPDKYFKLVPPGAEDRIIGVEACVWMGSCGTMKRLEFLIYPRLAALAEDGWTPAANKNYENFQGRVKFFMKWLDAMNVYYCNPFDPSLTPEPDVVPAAQPNSQPGPARPAAAKR